MLGLLFQLFFKMYPSLRIEQYNKLPEDLDALNLLDKGELP